MKTLFGLIAILFIAGCNDQGGVKEPEDVGEEFAARTVQKEPATNTIDTAGMDSITKAIYYQQYK